MSGLSAPACGAFAATPQATLALNSNCPCWPIDANAVRQSLSPLVRSAFSDTQQHLFADTGVFLHVADLRAMQAQVKAIEAVAQLPGYIAASGAQALQVETRGALMGYDFHLTETGPKLIEINTNAGGAFLVRDLQSSLSGTQSHTGSEAESTAVKLGDMFQSEWTLAGRLGVPQTIAIVDDDPVAQYLYSDMQAAAELLRSRFNRVVLLSAAQLTWSGTELSASSLDGRAIDLVYNRHTDFALASPAVSDLRAAYAANRVVLTPSPRHHALFASKRNLQTLGDAEQLKKWGATQDDMTVLTAIPATTAVSANNADALWSKRRELFFKPSDGFGGRAAYRGAKLTKRVWRDIVSAADGEGGLLGGYVAQDYVPASYRCLPGSADTSTKLKLDVRLYTYAGDTLAIVARLYNGQTTNFRTPGGGFAPIAVLNG